MPSIRIRAGHDAVDDEVPPRPARDDGRPRVVDGLGAFQSDWCKPRSECQIWVKHGRYGPR